MPKARGTTARKGNAVEIDMTGVETSGLIAEGDYAVQVAKVERKIAESSGKPTIAWEMTITSEKHNGGRLYYNTSLQPQALFNLKNLLICLGVSVPNSKFTLDLDDLPGRECGVTVSHEMYDGKKRSKITDIYPLDEASDEEPAEDEDVEPDEPEDEVEEDDEGGEEEEADEETPDYSNMTLAELKAACKERGLKVLKKDGIPSLIKKLEAADEAEDI